MYMNNFTKNSIPDKLLKVGINIMPNDGPMRICLSFTNSIVMKNFMFVRLLSTKWFLLNTCQCFMSNAWQTSLVDQSQM